MAGKKQDVNLTESLAELNAIVEWFDEQENVDVEQGLEKVREAAKLIKDSKTRLAQIENEFKEIEKEMGSADAGDEDEL
jgi:exonuclease VII small subunit